jgi:hypothetical protein
MPTKEKVRQFEKEAHNARYYVTGQTPKTPVTKPHSYPPPSRQRPPLLRLGPLDLAIPTPVLVLTLPGLILSPEPAFAPETIPPRFPGPGSRARPRARLPALVDPLLLATEHVAGPVVCFMMVVVVPMWRW